MKKLLLGLSAYALLGGTCFGAQAKQHCALATKVGPYSSFDIEYRSKTEASLKVKYSKASGATRESGVIDNASFRIAKTAK